jgi:transcriptional regulator with GAF, ATPase, and Fis domain
MREFSLKLGQTAPSFAGLVEKIEILRSALRWSSKLERPEIERLLTQCNLLRDEIMSLSRKDRFLQAAAEQPIEELEALPKPKAAAKTNTAAERRQSLVDRNLIFEGVFGDNTDLLDALEVAERAARTDLPVLIDGESGTGKELMAKVIHSNSPRNRKPFISVNCGAIPNELLESELFGHKKGSFTGAASDRKGKFEAANDGTIFLDEIGELPLHGQVKLLRVLQSNEIQRLGTDDAIAIDTRIVAATNRDLAAMAKEGRFREDLYYRLSVIRVTLPPLRERKDEIPLLIEFFTDEAAEKLQRKPVILSPLLRDFLLRHTYPGNIRELRNLIYRLSCLADEQADVRHLPNEMREHPAETLAKSTQEDDGPVSLTDLKKAASNDAEKRRLMQLLQESKGKVVEVARQTGMNRSHLQTLLKKHGIRSKDFKPNRAHPSGNK